MSQDRKAEVGDHFGNPQGVQVKAASARFFDRALSTGDPSKKQPPPNPITFYSVWRGLPVDKVAR